MADKKIIVNCETGEVLELDLTAEEITQRETDEKAAIAQAKQNEAEAKAKESARNSALAKLAVLGLTREEISAIS